MDEEKPMEQRPPRRTDPESDRGFEDVAEMRALEFDEK